VSLKSILASYSLDVIVGWDFSDASSINAGSPSNNDPIDSIDSFGRLDIQLEAAGTDRPTFIASAVNGMSAARFDRTAPNQLKATVGSAISDPETGIPISYTALVIYNRVTTATVQTRIFFAYEDAGSRKEYFGFNTTTNAIRYLVANGAQFLASDYITPPGEWGSTIVVKQSPTTVNHNFRGHGRLNPVAATAVGTGGRGSWDEFVVGDTDGLNPYDGDILAVLLIDATLDDGTAQSLLHDLEVMLNGAPPSGSTLSPDTAVVRADGMLDVTFDGEFGGYLKVGDVVGTITITSPVPSGGTAARSVKIGRIVAIEDVSGDTKCTFAISRPIFNDDDEVSAPTVDIDAGAILDNAGNTNGAASALAATNNSELDFPNCMARWAHRPLPWELFEDAEEISVEAAADHILGVEKVEFFVGDSETPFATATDLTKSPADGYAFYRAMYDLDGKDPGTIVFNFKAYPKYGLAANVRDSRDPGTNDDPRHPTGDAGADEYSLPIIYDPNGTIYDNHIHVSATTGDDDTGDGSEGDPYATIKKAVDSIGTYTPTVIHIADGAYVGGFTVPITVAGGHTRPLRFVGNIADPSLVTIAKQFDPEEANIGFTGTTDSFSMAWFRGVELIMDRPDGVGATFFGTPAGGTRYNRMVTLTDFRSVATSRCESQQYASISQHTPMIRDGYQEEARRVDGRYGRNIFCQGLVEDVHFPPEASFGITVRDWNKFVCPPDLDPHADWLQILASVQDGDWNCMVWYNDCEAREYRPALVQFSQQPSGSDPFMGLSLMCNRISFDPESLSDGTWTSSVDHVVITHMTTRASRFRVLAEAAPMSLWSVRNSVVGLSSALAFPEIGLDNNEWRSPGTFSGGVRQTVNSGGIFVDGPDHDLAPVEDSAIDGRLEADDLLIPFDLYGNAYEEGGPIGAQSFEETDPPGTLEVRLGATVLDSSGTTSTGNFVQGSSGQFDLTLTAVDDDFEIGQLFVNGFDSFNLVGVAFLPTLIPEGESRTLQLFWDTSEPGAVQGDIQIDIGGFSHEFSGVIVEAAPIESDDDDETSAAFWMLHHGD
jgi:hypothetical protein